MSDAKAAAKAVKAAGKLSVSSIELWGRLAVRPGDTNFAIKDARAVKDRLEVHLDAGDGPALVLHVWQPKGVKAKDGTVRIDQAARVRCGDYDIALYKDALSIFHPAVGAESGKPGKKPALLLA